MLNPLCAHTRPPQVHAWLDAIGCHPAFGGWILANEPDFRVSQTPHTMRKYRGWLKQRHGTIAALNQAWGTGFGSFAGVVSQPASPGDDPSDPLLLGGPVGRQPPRRLPHSFFHRFQSFEMYRNVYRFNFLHKSM